MMSKNIRPIIEALFASPDQTCEAEVFTWRLFYRKGHPFMMLPEDFSAARAGMILYSAQRWSAKVFRALIPWVLQTPFANFFQRITFKASSGSEIMRFIAQQTGVFGSAHSLTAIKFCEMRDRLRLVLLLCDQSGRPFRVIKVGLNSIGREDTNREADFLEKLPAGTIGCIRITGRVNLPTIAAFATDFFPGESPQDDAGMEHLFHAWLNPGPALPLESLPTWQALDSAATRTDSERWLPVKKLLVGKLVQTTLYHGDFAPWNVRVVSSQNLQAFDWERGQLQGIPAWDWFHFIIQTCVLPKRLSTERVAAEVINVMHSERFKKYAAAAGISDIVQPLLLSYLLNHLLVVRPLEGGPAIAKLFDILAEHWGIQAQAATPSLAAPQNAGLFADALNQLKSALVQTRNLFWEPRLNYSAKPLLSDQLRKAWSAVLLAGLLFAVLFAIRFHIDPHLILVPLYLAPCALLTWKINRTWGMMSALVAAAVSSLLLSWKDPDFEPTGVLIWNIAMRFIMLANGVLFLDRIHKEQNHFASIQTPTSQSNQNSKNWAVVLASSVWLIGVVLVQLQANPSMLFMPLYLLPCVVLTLTVGQKWGSVAVFISALAGPLVQYVGDVNYQPVSLVLWNIFMRLLLFQTIILMLFRIQRDHTIFFSPKAENSRESDQIKGGT